MFLVHIRLGDGVSMTLTFQQGFCSNAAVDVLAIEESSAYVGECRTAVAII
jgi:hypothetical protein